jgi:ion channel-forming bestrophin family protein
MGIASAVCIEHSLARNGIIPASYELTTLDSVPVTLTSFALSLLLVFRTNSSYGRFDEARKMWGLLLNRSRDIVREAVAFFPAVDKDGNSTQHLKATFARWTIAWSIALKCHLRPREDLQGEASKVLDDDELKLLLSADHKVRCHHRLHGSVSCSCQLTLCVT